MPVHSITIFTLAYLLPLPLAQLPQQKTPFKLAVLYNKSIADAHPSFLLKEAILFSYALNADDKSQHKSDYNSIKKLYVAVCWAQKLQPGPKARACIHEAKGRLTARSREVSNMRDSCSNVSKRPPAALPRCQISERYDHNNIKSRGFETSRDLVVRRPSA